jgi:hypothetical protein
MLTNVLQFTLRDGTGSSEMAELRGTARIGLRRPVFHPGAPRSLFPQLQMPKFCLGYPGTVNTLSTNFFYSTTTQLPWATVFTRVDRNPVSESTLSPVRDLRFGL